METIDSSKYYIMARHGEVDREPDLIIGSGNESGNIPLNSEGRIQAIELARGFQERFGEPSLIITSPLKRALETAEIVASNFSITIPIVPISALQAQNFGILEGYRVSEARDIDNLKPFLYMNNPAESRYTLKPPSGESLLEVSQRILFFLQKLSTNIIPTHRPILIITHGSILRAVNGRLKGIDAQYWEDVLRVDYLDFVAISVNIDSIITSSFNT